MLAENFHFGSITQTAGTAIIRTVPFRPNRIARITTLRHKAGTTLHTATVLKSLGSTTVVSGGAAAQADVVLAADPGPAGNGIAANDYVTFELPDGTTFQSTVNAWVAGTLTLTLNDNFPTGGVAVGAKVWDHGVAGDQTSLAFEMPASATTSYVESIQVGVAEGLAGEPMVVYVNNATVAGTLQQVAGLYAIR